VVAHDLLRSWLTQPDHSVTKLAVDLGVSRQTVHGWLAGALPRGSLIHPLELATAGWVPADAWYRIGWEQSPEGRAALARAGLLL
jgi:hypothetical protein